MKTLIAEKLRNLNSPSSFPSVSLLFFWGAGCRFFFSSHPGFVRTGKLHVRSHTHVLNQVFPSVIYTHPQLERFVFVGVTHDRCVSSKQLV